jgi:hypothetical protein
VIEIIEMPFSEVMKKIEDQTIRDAKSLVALQMAYGRIKH